jgi:uncharacterized protein
VHDRTALDAWVEAHGDRERRAEMMAGLASLPTGTAWMWSPQFLDLFAQVAVRQPTTFDSMATPKAGQKQIQPKRLAKADVAALTEKMASIIAEAEENDPRALKARIVDLQKALSKALAAKPVTEVEKIVVRVVEPDLADPMQVLSHRIQEALERFGHDVEVVISKAAKRQYQTFPKGHTLTGGGADGTVDKPVDRTGPTITPTPALRPSPVARKVDTPVDSSLNGPQRKLLIVLATHGPRTKRQLALQAGYAENGGAFANPLGRLRAVGYVTKGAPIEITDEGLRALGAFDPLPRGRELVDHWLASQSMSGPMAKILTALLDHYPGTYTRAELAEVTGYSPTGGAFANPLGKLRTLGLVNKFADITLTEEFAGAIS